MKIVIKRGAQLYRSGEKDILKAVRPTIVVRAFTVDAVKWVDETGGVPSIYEFEYEGVQYSVSEEFVAELGPWWERFVRFWTGERG